MEKRAPSMLWQKQNNKFLLQPRITRTRFQFFFYAKKGKDPVCLYHENA